MVKSLKIETLAATALLSEAFMEAGFGRQMMSVGFAIIHNLPSKHTHTHTHTHTQGGACSPKGNAALYMRRVRMLSRIMLCGERVLLGDYSNELAPQPP